MILQGDKQELEIFGKETDAVLSMIAQHPANTCGYDDCCDRFGADIVRQLIVGGVLRRSGAALAFDCPVFLREDAAVLPPVIRVKVQKERTAIF